MRNVEQKAYNKTYHLSKDWSRQIESENTIPVLIFDESQ